MGVKVKGGPELLAKIAEYKERAQGAAEAALYQRALMIMAASDSIVPVRYGRLRSSHYVTLPVEGKIHIGYGVWYALIVHERLDYHHDHGQAKFLEIAFDEFAPTNKAWLKAKILENIRRGVELESGSIPTQRGEE